MAKQLTSRQKKGIGLIVSGIASVVVGGVLVAATQTPDWVIVGLDIVGAVCNIFGLIFVKPDTQES
jgi:hypothetical protein